MDHKQVEEYLLSMPNAKLDYPFGNNVAVYKIPVKDEYKMFALIQEGSQPLKLSIKCDPTLAKILREQYVTVMEGYHLNKKHWNTLILTGEISWEDVMGFIRHSHDLVVGASHAYPDNQ
ncbi:MmcQ/YjbR family DNA-binding protein [Candidatus Saccharibacteria bacterium]|nr:MmcQ/YjbR family DNA-binding protein [Candidatus Saccharibacteria bacterium]